MTTGYYNPDLTGTHSDYKISNDVYALYQTNQKIAFDVPIFKDGLVVSLINTPNGYLTLGSGYTIQDDDVDQTSIARMKAYDVSFDKVLLKSVTFTAAIATGLTVPIALTYQRLYPVDYKTVMTGTELSQLTPGVLLDILGRVANLEAQTSGVGDAHSISDRQVRLLDEDPNCTNTANVIMDEVHTVDVFNRRNIIKPDQGAFFEGTVSLLDPDKLYTLVEGTDYICFDLDVPKTKTTNTTAAVYNRILLTYPYAGDLKLSYHAFGGNVSPGEVAKLDMNVNDVLTFLTSHKFLTANSILDSSLVKTMYERMDAVEDQMRSLIASGRPTYGDTTNGRTEVYKLRSVDTQYHWYTLAQLFKVDGSDEVTLADTFNMRLRFVNSGLMADVAIAANLQTTDMFTIDASAVKHDVGFVKYQSLTATPIAMPMFRIVTNRSLVTSPGALLQIGIALPTLTDVLAIEDRSGIESCWKLIPASAWLETSDNTILLPDGASYWDSRNSDSISSAHMFPTPSGYLVWAGSQRLTDFTYNLDPVYLTHRLPNNFLLDDIDHLEIDLYDYDNNTGYQVNMPMTGTTSDSKTGSAVFPLPFTTGAIANNARIPALQSFVTTIARTSNTLSVSVHMNSDVPADKNVAVRYIVVKLKS